MAAASSPADQVRVLLVDDHPQIRAAFERILLRAGYAVTCEEDAPGACARLRREAALYDVVVTDMAMPSGTGLDVLQVARETDPALPVVFVTGQGDVDLAQQALEHGALRFLVKPVGAARLLSAMEEACRVRAASSVSRSTSRLRALEGDLGRVKKSRELDAAFEQIWMALQPVGSLGQRRVVAYEALVRSDHPTMGRPDLLIGAAEELGRLPELGRRIRAICARRVDEVPESADLLINLHPSDLDDPDLYDVEAPLTAKAKRIILEITERASLDDIGDVHERIARLRELGYRIAVDDLGAGYGSLSAIALIKPDLVKLDMSLVRDVHQDPVRTRMVRSIGLMCRQLGTPWLCEGVETLDELRALVDAGADLIQGFLLGRPARAISGIADQIFAAAPRPARPTRASQRIAVGAMAQVLAREAQTLAAGVTGPESNELRSILGALREMLEQMGE